jgi:pimeloyl-ACP methyl ester carboxylesterase
MKSLHRFLRRIAVSLLSIGVLVFGLVYVTQDVQVYPRAAASLWSSSPDVPPPEGIERDWITTPDGCRLEVWSGRPAGPSKGTVLVLHGNGDVLDDFFVVQKAFLDGGYTAYAVEYRGFGRSSCWPSESGLLTDSKSGAEFAIAREKLASPSDLIVYGFSLGTGPASWLAVQLKSRALLLGAPYTSMIETARWRGFPEPLPSLLWTEFPTRRRFAEFETTNVLIVATRRDRAVPFEGSAALPALYKGRGQVLFRELDLPGHWEVAEATVKEALAWLPGLP